MTDDETAVPGPSGDAGGDCDDLSKCRNDMERIRRRRRVYGNQRGLFGHDGGETLSPVDAELLASAKAYVLAKEQGVNSSNFYRRLRRAWIASVRK